MNGLSGSKERAALIFRIATCVFCLFVLAGATEATAQVYTYQTISLLAETMQPLDSSISFNSDSGYLRTVQGSTIAVHTNYIGPLHLPDGYRIYGVQGFGFDTDPTKAFSFSILRYNHDSSPPGEEVTANASSGGPYRDGKITLDAKVNVGKNLVDNAKYSYGLLLSLPSAAQGELRVLRFVVKTRKLVQ